MGPSKPNSDLAPSQARRGMRIGLSALLLLAVFRPPLTRAQWIAVIPNGVVLGTMNLSF
ncbi:hypothetical protein [Cystobacter ferrugineus]|uniref:hypothetical protein n=1 Tax=Cystobacter ferrugineus TaxID=83449 RepID=UPI00165174F4|nr:hypothetical protein [Cystobacter ferrugineus]